MAKRLIVIGDLQGCYNDFQQLLKKLAFNPKTDKLWLAGDIVNRGKQSLACLRYVYQNQQHCKMVLGNHDLHLIAAYHQVRPAHKNDTLQSILDAPDAKQLIHWLRQQPLIRYHQKYDIAMVHAGIYPNWSIKKAKKYAKEAQTLLKSDQYLHFIQQMYGNLPDKWPAKDQPKLQGVDRIRFIINSFTRMRYVDNNLHLDMKHNGAIGTQPNHLQPWFSIDNKKLKNSKVVFGHWSTVRIENKTQFYPIDTGCIWGEKLTALVLEKNKQPQTVHLPCQGALSPI